MLDDVIGLRISEFEMESFESMIQQQLNIAQHMLAWVFEGRQFCVGSWQCREIQCWFGRRFPLI